MLDWIRSLRRDAFRWCDMHPRKGLFVILLLASAVITGRLVTETPTFDDGQPDNYWPLANNLIDGQGYSLCYPLYFPFCNSQNQAKAMREPLPALVFAAVVWITGSSLEATVVVMTALFMAILLVLYGFARSWLGQRAAWLAALFWAFCLPAIKLLNQLSGDLMGTFFLVAASWALLHASRTGRIRHWMLTGACLGLGMLSRSALIVLILPWLIAVAWFSWRRQNRYTYVLRSLAAFALAITMVLAPWVIRNHQVFGKVIVGTTMNGYNVFRNSHQVSTPDYLRFIDHVEADSLTKQMVARRTDLTGQENEAEMDAVYRYEGLQVVKAHFGRYLVLCLWRAIPLWTNWGVNQAYGVPIIAMDHLIVIQQLLLLVLMIIGMRRIGWVAWPWAAAIAIVVVAYMALVAQVRYLVPILPLVICFAAVGCLHLFRADPKAS